MPPQQTAALQWTSQIKRRSDGRDKAMVSKQGRPADHQYRQGVSLAGPYGGANERPAKTRPLESWIDRQRA